MKEFNGKNIIIMCCSKCNIKCEHCYIEYNDDYTPLELENIIKNLKDRYSITLNGSELLLNKGYLKCLKQIKQDRVLTNGIVIYKNDKLLNEMRKTGIKWVGISYHFALHDLVSKVNKKIIIEDIKKLKEFGFKVEIMTTISTTNYRDIEKMVKEAIDLKVDCIRFTNLFNEGRTINLDNKLLLNDNEINEFFDQFYKCKEKYKKQILVRRSGTFSRDFRKEKSKYYCPSSNDTVALAPNNKVYPCPFLIKEGYEIGKYENGKIYLEYKYYNDKTTCMLHEILNRGKKIKKEYLKCQKMK